MARLTPKQLLAANHRGDFLPGLREYRSPAEAYSKLKQMTGETRMATKTKSRKSQQTKARCIGNPAGTIQKRTRPVLVFLLDSSLALPIEVSADRFQSAARLRACVEHGTIIPFDERN